MTDSEYEDEEAAEEFKIHSFVAMVTNCRKIGIPYSTTGSLHSFDKMVVEKWPIIQAYALDEYTGGGFFTMKHEVVDVSSAVHKIFNEVDPTSLELLITEQLSMFERQWKTMLITTDMEMLNNSRQIQEEKVCEALRSYYKHGKVGSETAVDRQTKPFVLFGTNTKKTVMESVRIGETTVNTPLMKAGVDGDIPKLMVCYGVCPNGPITCGRTYFFTGFSDQLSDKSGAPSEDEETRMLVQVYGIMIDAVIQAIQVYVKTLSSHLARAAAVDIVCEECHKLGSPMIQKYIQRRSNIIFTLEAHDNSGQSCQLPDGEHVLRVKTASISLTDIPSYRNPAKILGSLLYSDVFIDSVIQVQKDDGTIARDYEVLNLTGQIPKYLAWSVRDKGKDEVTILEENLKNMKNEGYGSVLISGESVHVGSHRNVCQPPLEASLFMYQHKIVLFCPQTGAVILDNSIIKSLQFFDDDNSRSVAILLIEIKITMKSTLPSYLVSNDNLILVSFNPKSKAYKHMYSVVLPEWRKESELPDVIKIQELPECFTQIHEVLQNIYSNTTKTVTGFRKATASLQNIDRFLYHFSAGSAGNVPFEEKYLSLVVNREAELSESSGTFEVLSSETDQIIINIIAGIDGSHKENLCNTLVKITKDRYSWTVLQQDLSQSTPFIPQQLNQSLKSLSLAHRNRSSMTDPKHKSRVLLVTPGSMDVYDVILAIKNHPDLQVRQKLNIGAVTVCIDPMHSFITHRMTFPVLLNQCAQGWVNFILFTSSTSINNSALDDLQKLIRSVNSDVSFFLADKGEITRSMDIDAVLSETAFMEKSKVRARHLLYPGWSLGLQKNYPPSIVLQNCVLKFKRPLERQLLINRLRELKSSLKPYPFEGNVYFVDGQSQFGDSSQTTEVKYATLTDSLSIVSNGHIGLQNGDGHHQYFMSFTGCNLQEKALKDWLRACAKQIPQKKKLVEKKDLKKEEIKKIHSQHHLDPLPAGWFYNGTQFVSFDGEKQDIHPCLEDFIQQYINSKNREVEKFNSKADMEARMFVDLFS
ncbi:dynein axonemal assembly factor 9-like isoform X13 [Mytilus californianus]|nr:dynein axonemal assembly factor 9-like isoform X2 [Mytilus californianus]XP_052099792.1 dynein axonemal assembly factor 9-like isoform X3 [Mytilus californianus]XP_052099793.1 dynein axonemal assembly factor 9-like isoform X4 [Mytilus californianus]XP_052099794.1 dynein axonemal assembly factor 9-like isoform X5 [Mytilus californianus]XP_052099795.1 dynein axonemal assembly factor 9-like isoform X6 [Mytilus californianus]XP_052099796.1 dynein axonemal assembly factor 9-like isoform X7 [Myti